MDTTTVDDGPAKEARDRLREVATLLELSDEVDVMASGLFEEGLDYLAKSCHKAGERAALLWVADVVLQIPRGSSEWDDVPTLEGKIEAAVAALRGGS